MLNNSIRHRESICILTTVHVVFDIRIFHKQAKSLYKAGYDITLIAQHEVDEMVGGIKIVGLRRPKSRFDRMTSLVWRAFRKAITADADIYHLHDPELMPVAFMLKIMGKKVVYDMHENLPRQVASKSWINPVLRKLLPKIIYFFEFLILVRIPVIFAEHSYLKDYSWVNKYSIVLNMPIIARLTCLGVDVAVKKDFAIGYIGGVSTLRGNVATIEVLNILKKEYGFEPRFDCVGPMSDAHKSEVLTLCASYNLSNVIFHGYLSPEKGWAIIAKCSIGLALLSRIPNYLESYPTKIFEYMAMKIPVITSDFTLYKEVIGDADCGFCIDPLEYKEIADTIYTMFQNPDRSLIMGDNGFHAVQTKYNWALEEKKLLDFYTTI